MTRPGFTYGTDGRKKLAVISHERSGTHFLMNTVGNHFGYIAKPWWNFDFDSLTINFHATLSIQRYLRIHHDKSILNILKSHHPADFFDGILDYVADQFHILYIYRDPRDAIVSNWKLIRSFPWDEGPKPESAGEFIRAEPRGGMMRYQKIQQRNMLHRWKSNVESWLIAAEKNPQLPICLLKYEDLDKEFEKTLGKISQFTGIECGKLAKPKVDENVIGSGEGGSGNYKKYLTEEDLDFVDQEIGGFMASLGYLR